MERTARVACALLVLSILSIASVLLIPSARAATPEGDFDQWVADVHAYVDGLERAAVADAWGAAGWAEAVDAQLVAEEAARQAAAAAARRTPQTTTAAGVTVTGACGGATNGADAYIDRESKGQPGVWNTRGSGAWGCYQIMPGTWNSSCSDLGVHGAADASAQAACASRLPLSAWGG